MLTTSNLPHLLNQVFGNVWLKDLMDLTARNKLINCKKEASSSPTFINILNTDVDTVFGFFSSASKTKIVSAGENDTLLQFNIKEQEEGEVKNLFTDLTHEVLIKTAEKMRSNNNVKVIEKGIWASHIALGFLNWRRSKDNDWMRSPIILIPVIITIENNNVKVSINNSEDIKLNHALPVALDYSYSHLGFNLESFFESFPDISGVSSAFKKIEDWLKSQGKKTASLSEWNIEYAASLINVASDTELIYYDLSKHVDTALKHKAIVSFAKLFIKNNATSDSFTKEDIGDINHVSLENKENIYETFHKNETPPLIFPADSSQTKAISACLLNPETNFIIQGPPGTGKSQTIANLIAAYVYHGKKVLFVSEKAAAIDVVKNRLTDVGLKDIFLNLHTPMTRMSFKAELNSMLSDAKRKTREEIETPSNREWLKYLKRLKAVEDLLYYENPTTRKEIKTMMAEVLNGFAETMSEKHNGVTIDSDKLPKTSFETSFDLDYEDWIEAEKAIEEVASYWHTIHNDPTYHWHGFDAVDYLLATEKVSALRTALQNIVAILDSNINLESIFTLDNIDKLSELEEIIQGAENTDVDFIKTTPKSIFEQQTVEYIKEMVSEINELQQNWEAHNKILKTYEWFDFKNIDDSFDFKQYEHEIKSGAALVLQLDEKIQELTEKIKLIAETNNYFRDKLNVETKNFTAENIISFKELSEYDISILKDYLAYYEMIARFDEILEEAKKVEEAIKVLEDSKIKVEEYVDLTIFNAYSSEETQEGLNVYKKTDRKPGMFANKDDKKIWLEREKFAKIFKNKDKSIPAQWAALIEYDKTLKEATFIIENNRFFTAEKLNLKKELYDELRGNISSILSVIDTTKKSILNTETVNEAIKKVPTDETMLKQFVEQIVALNGNTELGGHIENLDKISQLINDKETLLSLFKNLNTERETFNILKTYFAKIVKQKTDTVTLKNLQEAHAVSETTKQLNSKINTATIKHNIALEDKGLKILPDIKNSEELQNYVIYLQNMSHKAAKIAGTGILTQNSSEQEIEAVIKLKQYSEKISNIIGTIKSNKDWLEKNFHSPNNIMGHLTKSSVKEMMATLYHMEINPDNLTWKKYSKAVEVLKEKELEDVLDYIFHNKIIFYNPESTADNHSKETKAYFEAWFRTVIYSKLIRQRIYEVGASSTSNMSVKDMEKILQEEKRIIEQGTKILLTKHYNNVIQASESKPEFTTAQTTIRGSIKKGLSLKERIESGWEFITTMRPCIMMSPKTVSELLPARRDLFDVVIYDEASQITIPRAINSLYRAKQIIVVGDDLQMPPSRFFGTTAADTDDTESLKDFQSIMDAANSSEMFNNEYALTVHYRSQHDTLIWFSRNHFYKELASIDIDVPPSNQTKPEKMGIHWVDTPKNSYTPGSQGKSGGYNREEAKMIASAIIEHFENRRTETLGVIAFSQTQQNTIEEELNNILLNSGRSRLKTLIEASKEDRLNGLFIKNIENIQGDERDIILMSVGYGTDLNGTLAQRFGPINNKDGHRRLNVAITRAKQKLVVFSSMSGSDVTAQSDGAKYFALFLSYAQNPSIKNNITHNSQKWDSPFEAEVGKFIESLGYKIESQVGVSNFRIDIGVYKNGDEGKPSHNFGLGIECDGATYHSSNEARTRDITRQEILEGKGWNIHRIWSTEWFTNRRAEEQRLEAALNKYCGELRNISHNSGGHISKQASAMDNEIML